MKQILPIVLGAMVLLAVVMVSSVSAAEDRPSGISTQLQGPETFDSIADLNDRAIAMFVEAGKVLSHPRCVNCHPADRTPLQGEDGAAHQPPVVRGRGGIGVVGMRCRTCHLAENFDPGRVPGAPHWLLAPDSMAWEHLTLGEICDQIKDPDRNGGRTLEDIVEHVSEDALVAWGWSPGAGRQPAPGSQAIFAALIRGWVDLGAACP